jgi:methionyl-tRNA formyltransferase
MKIGIVSNAAFCMPLLQTLMHNRIQASVFADACIGDQSDLQAIGHFCQQARMPFQQGDPDSLYFWLEETRPDIVFVMGFTHLIRVEHIDTALRNNIYNMHFGPLPAYRGPNPVFWQIRNGEAQLTATIHRINDKFDAGDVVWSKSVQQENYMSFGIANMVLAQVVIEGAIYLIEHTIQKKLFPVIKQVAKKATYYKRPTLADVLINWDNMHAKAILNLVLACNPWNKGAITLLNGQEIKILDAVVSEEKNSSIRFGQQPPGTIISHKNNLGVICADQHILSINMLNINGAFVPGRHANTFGLTEGRRLCN